MYITDNNYEGHSLKEERYSSEFLRRLSNSTIFKLIDEEKILFYPEKRLTNLGNSHILTFKEVEKKVYTNNILGFIGDGETDVFIHSRFDRSTDNYFLHYMLQRIQRLNIFDLSASIYEEDIYDFLFYLFPKMLKEAVAQGIYKAYRHRSCNDARVKGRVDVARHLRSNLPCKGRVAYTMREHSADNSLTQLVRHCIAFIERRPLGKWLLQCDEEMRTAVAQICEVTPSFKSTDVCTVLAQNKRAVVHPFYQQYQPLQRLCMAILERRKFSYGQGKHKMYGLLFDGAWLWEEYLAVVMADFFTHYGGDKKEKLYLLERETKEGEWEPFQEIIPDYLSRDKKVVADAKYIPLNESDKLNYNRTMGVYYKTIMYMHRFNSRHGLLLYPFSKEYENAILVKDYPGVTVNRLPIIDTQSELIKVGLKISPATNFKDFCEEMRRNETCLIDVLRGL
jgi:5-methylcytosine-specific restriction endonuclease McrBC regulatory subunit McrC